MAQTPSLRVQTRGDYIDYTPASTAVVAGDVVVVGTIPLIATGPIAVGVLGALAINGIFDVPKDTSTFSAGDAVYWNASGSPVVGTASSGAATSSAGTVLMGWATADAATGASTVRVMLTSAKRTATLAGSLGADDITGTDASLAIVGLAAAQGGTVAVAGGVSSTGGNAGGPVTVTGGVPGATGVGGATTIAGGPGGTTSGAGGPTVVAGGAGTLNASGGALALRGGAKNGSGTDGTIAIGDSNTASVTFGKMPRIPTGTVAAAGTIQGDAGALVEGFNLVSAADGTKGVRLPLAVAGMQVLVKCNANAVLKVWPGVGDAINAIATDSAMSLASGLTSALFTAYDATTWYTLPLLPS